MVVGRQGAQGAEMPWFPEFVTAVELARSQTRAAGQADPVGQYFAALKVGDSHVLETAWPGHVVVHDARVGEVRGRRQLRHFVSGSQSWLAERHARVEQVTSLSVYGRSVVELLAHVRHDGGREAAWPVAVVAESPDDQSVVFRTYFSQLAVDGRRHLRPPILKPAHDAEPGDVVGRHLAGLEAGDTEAVLSTFGPGGYLREPGGPDATHRGTAALRAFFIRCFSAGGGIGLQRCAVTDDGVSCALEYNCVRWGRHDLPPQAGLAVYERGPGGLLAAVRIYDDIEPPPADAGGGDLIAGGTRVNAGYLPTDAGNDGGRGT
jgi:hypothetical protein